MLETPKLSRFIQITGKKGLIFTAVLAVIVIATAITYVYWQQEPRLTDLSPDKIVGEVELPKLSEKLKKQPQKVSPGKHTTESEKIELHKDSAYQDLNTSLPDFSQYNNVEEKKIEFFEFLKPIIKKENQRVLKERAFVLLKLKEVKNGMEPTPQEIDILEQLASKYRVNSGPSAGIEFYTRLLLHIDIIPVELALIQAANESAWGTSYFARKGNNLFGQWCFEQGCGIVPRRRAQGAKHEVKDFPDVFISVREYIQNLNSHPAYKKLRIERYKARLNGMDPDASDIAIGLQNYSGIGMEYVNIVRQMISHNQIYMN